MMRFTVGLDKVDIGKNENWLRFEGYIPHLSNDRKYTFDYCGTELDTDASLTDEDKERLLEEMKKSFGYAPFDDRIDEIKEEVDEYFMINVP